MFTKFKGWAASGTYGVTVLSDSVTTADISNGDTLSFVFNAAGRAAINKTGITQFFQLGNHDICAIDPGTNKAYVQVGDDSPYLTVTYNEVSGLTIDGVANVVVIDGITFTAIDGITP